jgi:hypothetical protein
MTTRSKVGVTLLAVVLVVATATISSAITASTTVSGKSMTSVKVVQSTIAQTFTDDGGATTATNLSGAGATVKVPAGQKALLLIRFSADTACYGGTSGGYDQCYVQVLVNGHVAAPGEVSFDNNNNNTEAVTTSLRDAHAMEWAKSVGAGTYDVQVQVRTDDSPCCVIEFDLDHWTLSVERIRR